MPAGMAQTPKLGTSWFMNMIMMPVTKAAIDADGKVEAAGRDHERRADRDDGDERRLRVTTLAMLVADRKSGLIRKPTPAARARARNGPASVQLNSKSRARAAGGSIEQRWS